MLGFKNIMSVSFLLFGIFAIGSNSAASPALGENPDPNKPWGEFAFSGTGLTTFGCTSCTVSSGGNSFYLGDPPWEFFGGGFLIVQDAFNSGDQFRIFDNGAPLIGQLNETLPGVTSTPALGDFCTDPVICFDNDNFSKDIFPLSGGAHVFTIEILSIPPPFTGGAAFFCIDTGTGNCGVSVGGDPQVPEPSSMLLVAVGFLGAFVWLRRPELCRSVIRIIRKRERR